MNNPIPHRLVRQVFFVIAAVLLAGVAAGQACRLTLSGNISDADTKEPLAAAEVVIKENGRRFTTDAEGHYHFHQLCAGNYTLTITHEHCRPLEVKLRVEADVVQNFVLPHKYNEMEAVQVLGRTDADAATVKESLSNKDIAETRGLSLGEVLKRVNGVTVLQTGSTIFKPVIHGLHSQRVLILNNGVRQEGQQWGSEHAPEIDPFTAGRFAVLKGAGALRYGPDAIGGAILVEPRPLKQTPGTAGEINTAWFANNRQWVVNGMVEQQARKSPAFSWRLHATYKIGGNTRTPAYWLSNTGLQEMNYSATAGWRKPRFKTDLYFSAFSTRIGIFTGSHIGNLTDLETAIASDKPVQNNDRFSYDIDRPRQEARHYLAKWRTVLSLPGQNRLNITLSHQENVRREYDRALITSRPELDLTIGTSTADINWEQNPQRPRHTLLGATVMRQENVWDGSRFFIPNFLSWNAAAYAIQKWNWSRWAAEAGVRYDVRTLETFRNQNNVLTSRSLSFSNPSASAGLTRYFNSRLKWLLNAAMAWRAPQVNELYVNGLHHGTATFEIGDSLLTSEKAYNFSTQLKYDTDSAWQADVTVYYNLVNGFINLTPSTPATLTLRGAYPTFRFRQTNALLAGTDVTVGRVFSRHFSAQAKAAFLWARNRKANTWLQQMPANRTEVEATWWFNHHRLQNSYLSLAWLHVMRQTRVPGGEPDYLPPPGAYNLLNVEFATALQIFGKSLNFGCSVHNALNTRYRDYMNRFRYFNDEAGRNVVLRLRVPVF